VNETARLGRLVQSLLVLARLDAAPHEVIDIDVAATVADRAETWTPVAVEQCVQLTSASESGLLARALPGALEQILDNLVANALDVAPAHSTVRIEADPAGDGIDVHVIDQGPGMSQEQRRHAFERFWRPPGATGEGFGLGLAIVAQLAEASGGLARIDTGPMGIGTDVVVHLPLASTVTAPPAPRAEILNRALTST
jgi:signal transduction histidine kinase